MPAQAPPAHLMLALAAVVLLGAHGAAAQVPQVPSWARLRTDATTSQRTALLNWNRMLVSHANSSNATFDLAWWGDSTTSTLMFFPERMAEWDAHWGFDRNWTAAALGVGASDIEELTWRMAVGGEKFANDPLIAVLLIGLNNSPTDPQLTAKLDFLLQWMQAAMPRTRIVVLGPLPSVKRISALLLQAYRPVLRARCVELSLCGQDLNPANRTAYDADGIHLQGPGYRHLFDCMLPRLTVLRDALRLRRFGHTW